MLAKNPYVDKAKVFVTVNGGLIKTRIFHKKPVARIISGESDYYLDDKGYEDSIVGTNYSAQSVPLVERSTKI